MIYIYNRCSVHRAACFGLERLTIKIWCEWLMFCPTRGGNHEVISPIKQPASPILFYTLSHPSFSQATSAMPCHAGVHCYMIQRIDPCLLLLCCARGGDCSRVWASAPWHLLLVSRRTHARLEACGEVEPPNLPLIMHGQGSGASGLLSKWGLALACCC